jgi:hypothetical protein
VVNVPDVGHDGRRMSVAAAPVVASVLHAGDCGPDGRDTPIAAGTKLP